MKTLALTGNVAAGKSVVADLLEGGGIAVVRADELARAAVRPGSWALAEIQRAFGDGMIDSEGSLDRGRMRALVFSDPEARGRLEAILHPEVRRLRDEWAAEQAAEGVEVVVVEIPLVYEMGIEDEFDAVILVHASEPAREDRLVVRRGLDRAAARALMAAQHDADAKIPKADRVLHNDGTLDELEAKARRLLADIREGRFP